MRKKLKKKAVFTIGALMTLCSIVPLLVFSLIVNQNITSIMQNNVTVNYQQTIDELAMSLSMNVQPFIDLLQHDTRREDIVNFFYDSKQTQVQEPTAQTLKQLLLNKQTAVRLGYPYYYFALLQDGTVYSEYSVSDASALGFSEEPWLSEMLNIHNYSIRIMTGKRTKEIGHKDRLYIAGTILKGNENCGILMYTVNISFLEKLLSSARYGEHSSLFILDGENNCIAAGDKNDLDKDRLPDDVSADAAGQDMVSIDGVQYMVMESPMVLSYVNESWKVMALVPAYEVFQETTHVKLITISLTLFLMLVILGVVLYLHDRYIRPIEQLYQAMREVRHGDLAVRMNVERDDEVGELLNGFDGMVQSMDDNIRRIHEEEDQKRELELRILQEQINPHFISNTLNTIRVMADMRHASGISAAIVSFVHLLEYYFRETDSMAPICDEMEHLKEYIYLQNLRYQNRFSFAAELDPELERYEIPKLTLQPLVENCICHAFPERCCMCRICVSGHRKGQEILIRVQDNGVGLTPEQLELYFSEQALDSAQTAHKGVSNVHKRIRLRFGKPYGLSADSTAGEGTTVTVRLPAADKDGGRRADEGSDRR